MHRIHEAFRGLKQGFREASPETHWRATVVLWGIVIWLWILTL